MSRTTTPEQFRNPVPPSVSVKQSLVRMGHPFRVEAASNFMLPLELNNPFSSNSGSNAGPDQKPTQPPNEKPAAPLPSPEYVVSNPYAADAPRNDAGIYPTDPNAKQ
jgi:hypothetical protein